MKAYVYILLALPFLSVSCKKDSNNGDTISDVDGNSYHIIKIGTQTWMAENLKTTKYNDGTSIPQVTNNTDWSNLSTPGFCWYSNDSVGHGTTNGALYNWYAIKTGKLAPIGWHVAADSDWTALTTFLGGESIAGNKLKEAGSTHWQNPNTGATNESGFNALPGGYRNKNGSFSDIGISGDWWSSTEANSDNAWFRGMGYNLGAVARESFNKKYGFTVRCVKD